MAMTEITTAPEWEDAFLVQLASHGLLNRAAAAVGTTAGQVKKRMEESIEFETAVEEALEAATDALEFEARRRALEGVEKGVYYKGELVTTETQYSDSLMIKFLEAKRRNQFGNKTEVTGAGGQPLTVNIRTFPTPSEQASDPLPHIIDAVILPTTSTPTSAEDFV